MPSNPELGEESADLKGLKKQRTSMKRNISNLKGKTEKDGNKVDVFVLECRLEILETYFTQLCHIQNSIERINADDTDRVEFEESFILAKSKLRSLLNDRRGSIVEQGNSTTFLEQGSHQRCRLPKLKLPQFDGKYCEYRRFIDSFTKLVHEDSSIPVIEKFNYLLNCLGGAALQVVESFQVTSENYEKALVRLSERYDNKVLIFLDHITALVNLTPMKKSDPISLRKIIDTVSALRSSLLSIGNEGDVMNAIIVHIVTTKLDQETKLYHDESLDFKELVSWDECYKTLDRRCLQLETQPRVNKPEHHDVKQSQRFKGKTQSFLTAKANCAYCQDNSHMLGNCPQFILIPIAQRFDFVKRTSHCINCLRKGHVVSRCLSKSRCRVCQQSHHSVLHKYTAVNSNQANNNTQPSDHLPISTTTQISLLNRSNRRSLIPTALIYIRNTNDTWQPVRAILDSCSEVNFITEETAKRLQLKLFRTNEEVAGISDIRTPLKHFVVATIKSRISTFERTAEFLVTKSITSHQPAEKVDLSQLSFPDSITMADPQFFKPQRTDVLLNSDIFFDMLKEGKISLGEDQLSLVNTEFGWVVGGSYKAENQPQIRTCHVALESRTDTLEILLQKFWEVEELIPKKLAFTPEETQCENHFVSNVKVQSDGRINVRLPLKDSDAVLGESYDTAYRRFLSIERRLQRDETFKTLYVNFMQEYSDLGHMSPVTNVDLNKSHYIIPHHGVLKASSQTTKLRVVFDASSRTTSGRSLNDMLLVGATIQQPLILTLMSFRLYKFALIADICKMYRQFIVNKSDRKYQMILWRKEPSHPIQAFELNTITYGMSSSPFLAIRSLQYIAQRHKSENPVGALALEQDVYVDDILTGADTLEELRIKRNEISKILSLYGITLAKWNSNIVEAISDLYYKDSVQLPIDDITKALGMSWKPTSDMFCFEYSPPTRDTATKRSVLSNVARIFDVLGLLSPIVVRSKMLLQEIWLQRLEWDEPLPERLHTFWSQVREDLSLLRNIEVPRYVFTSKLSTCDVHGFADASTRAYGCCIYIRAIIDGKVETNLLIAKSRVAPIKAQSLPRLELCAAVLLHRLWQQMKIKVEPLINQTYFWTDSQIVLHWLKMPASTLNCFVANRVSELQDNSSQIIWRHVPSKQNPADIVSRGCSFLELTNSIWFKGPDFLQRVAKDWPNAGSKESISTTTLELRKPVALVCHNTTCLSVIETIINNNSSYYRIVRILSYVFRIFNKSPMTTPQTAADIIHLAPIELNETFLRIIAALQQIHFKEEFRNLEARKSLAPSLQTLAPFIDTIKINHFSLKVIRVGGRLLNADIPYEAKFPCLFPKHHRFLQLYIEYLHRSNLHAGPKILLSILRQHLWVINAREVVRKVVRQCVHCFHYKPKLMGQLMGHLPANRLRAHRPFLVSGVDFCGPFYTTHRLRGKPKYKTYVALFVCFASKAIHAELVSDLSTNNFLLALKRFAARRGVPQQVWCDNATNFTGANNKLKAFKDTFLTNQAWSDICSFGSHVGCEFKFIPPRAPHFGGLWEAAVKSAKTLLIKNAEHANLTYEELQTVLLEVESILNSRPLTALTDDPNDGEALTPAHLLIGDTLKSLPDEDVTTRNISTLTQWQRVSYLKQQFWKLWLRDYILQLQQRSKWTKSQTNLQVGQLVIVHEDHIPPQQWILARVTKVIPGSDGRIRVVDLKTTKTSFRRPIHKIAPLPLNDST